MIRLPVVFSLFLSVSITVLVALLSLMVRVTPSTIITRSLTVFFLFGITGAVFGYVVEVLLMSTSTEIELKKLHQEMRLDHPEVIQDLGDLPSINPAEQTVLPLADHDYGETGPKLAPIVVPKVQIARDTTVSSKESVGLSVTHPPDTEAKRES